MDDDYIIESLKEHEIFLDLQAGLREKHIVLLGEAGCGKSIALNQLSSAASNTQYYPLLYNLNNYTDNSIEEIVFSVPLKKLLAIIILLFHQ